MKTLTHDTWVLDTEVQQLEYILLQENLSNQHEDRNGAYGILLETTKV
jgi:hypothetical protein